MSLFLRGNRPNDKSVVKERFQCASSVCKFFHSMYNELLICGRYYSKCLKFFHKIRQPGTSVFTWPVFVMKRERTGINKEALGTVISYMMFVWVSGLLITRASRQGCGHCALSNESPETCCVDPFIYLELSISLYRVGRGKYTSAW